MSDLAATSCGCGGGSCGLSTGGNGCNIIIWIILLSCLCKNGGGLGGVFGGGDDCGCDGDRSNCSTWLILILLFCGCGCGF